MFSNFLLLSRTAPNTLASVPWTGGHFAAQAISQLAIAPVFREPRREHESTRNECNRAEIQLHWRMSRSQKNNLLQIALKEFRTSDTYQPWTELVTYSGSNFDPFQLEAHSLKIQLKKRSLSPFLFCSRSRCHSTVRLLKYSARLQT